MNIYTRTGDEGMTSLKGGRVPKDHLRVEAYGQLDELNAFVGVALTHAAEDSYAELREQLQNIQHELFDCGSDLAFAEDKLGKVTYKVTEELVLRLERWIDEHNAANVELRRFILPGGSALASALHVCRTVCRRAERHVVSLARSEEINPYAQQYVNRLSDYFFVAARRANGLLQVQDVEYARSAVVFSRKEKKE
ncbi:cob(I)yrinic acid a,c-diamide adenosyltransferase [Paenibacillus aquistagni]|uniref:cob(I)yrinic acid a,c-diamide adenosyltransferase n=1 Tax=Paenibacillus aquistagni TaxID=1852522 RepID=UPI00145AC7F5|nr:cob(I)yrinic acid a,c-diamide adenosyltransferase [Paenibacillus aquistagni]NMM53841.1 cob(I)yrinic acid a,c-diamide adenosyltransferase [Paenibacillus aquistagni]